MKHQLNQTLLLLVLLSALALGCKKEASAPKVTTSEVTEVSQNTAKSGCTVTDDGGANATTLGLCWSTSPTPTVSDSTISENKSATFFPATISWLTANTTYYLRAYATNSAGTGYGNTVFFTTLPAVLPEIKSVYPSNVTQTTAKCGGEVTSDGGAPTTRGVCWSTSENPTIADSKTIDGTGAGEFISNLSGLTRSTTYYARAYATNISGTSYGSQMVVRTMQGTVTDIDGNVYQTVLIGTQEWLAENLKVTHYCNGDAIPNTTDNNQWYSTELGSCCNYNNDPTNKNIYGLLYKVLTVLDSRGLCPVGWHVPSDVEWTALTNYIGGEEIAGFKLKKVGNHINADNSSGFSALMGGWRIDRGDFQFLNNTGFWWSSTLCYADHYYVRYLYKDQENLGRSSIYDSSMGFSIRCLKDN